MKLLIADDERVARERLGRMVAQLYPEAVLIQASNGDMALREAKLQEADIALLDIRMPGLDGLEVARRMSELPKAIPVIFTTAWERHALKAFDCHAVAYLLKPVRMEELQFALERARQLSVDVLPGGEPDAAGAAPQQSRRKLSVFAGRRWEFVPIDQISYLRAENKCVFVGHMGNDRLIDEALSAIEEEFPTQLLRIHRNALIALHDVKELRKDLRGNYWEVLFHHHDRRLVVSRRHLSKVKQRLKDF